MLRKVDTVLFLLPFPRLVALLLGAGLGGCAMQQQQPATPAPAATPAASVLRQAEETAYREGFAQGAQVQYRHDHAVAEVTAGAKPAGAPPTPSTPPIAAAAPTAQAAATPVPLPTSAPGQNLYDPSGPARPVGNATSPF